MKKTTPICTLAILATTLAFAPVRHAGTSAILASALEATLLAPVSAAGPAAQEAPKRPAGTQSSSRPSDPAHAAPAHDAPAHDATSAPTKKPNLLLVTLDTTRADHLGCYGYSRAETPNIDRLAVEGARAEQAIAVAPLTLPSHASILTSLYPPHHGIRDNADFRLPDSVTTLAEHLKTQGYGTVAIVASVVLSGNLGLAQGFDVYDEPREQTLSPASGLQVVYSPILERPASAVTDVALRLLENRREPFFLWVHYYDPHYEYAPPAPYARRFAGRLYDGEIAFTDAQLGRLLDFLRERRLLDRTLVALTADHGEGLGEHGEETHGLFIYEAMVRVPLILRLPGLIPAGTRLGGLISGIDLAPSLLELLSLPPLPSAEGKSFAPAARGEAAQAREPVYAETIYPERLYGWAPLFALRQEGRKFIEAPYPEIYDLRADPGELHNLAAAYPEEVALWRKRLAEVRSHLEGADRSAEQPMDAEQREKLASLGYLSGGAPGSQRSTGSDPKRLVAQHNALMRAKWLVSKGRFDQARTLIRAVLKVDPGNPAALSLNGTLLVSGGQGEPGLAQLEAAVRAAPGVYENERNLANALHLAGRHADAARAYRAALAIHPFSGADHYGLGNVLFAMRDPQGAVKEYNEAIRLGETSPGVHAALGVALAATGDAAGAEASLQAAVAADPKLAGAWYSLGVLAEKAGRTAEAVGRFERALEADPDDAAVLFSHARICLLLGDQASAKEDYERLVKTHPGDPQILYLKAHLRLAAGDSDGARKALEDFLGRPGADPRLIGTAKQMLETLAPSAH